MKFGNPTSNFILIRGHFPSPEDFVVLSIKIMFGTSENAHCFPMPLASIYTQPLRGFMHRKAIAQSASAQNQFFKCIPSSVHPFTWVSLKDTALQNPKTHQPQLGVPPFPIFADCTMTSNTLVGKPALGSSICWTFSEPQTVGATSTDKVCIT